MKDNDSQFNIVVGPHVPKGDGRVSLRTSPLDRPMTGRMWLGLLAALLAIVAAVDCYGRPPHLTGWAIAAGAAALLWLYAEIRNASR